MRRTTSLLLGILAAVTAVDAGAVGVLSRWVMPTRLKHTWELRPHERTRPIVVGDIVYFANLDGDVFSVHRTEGYVFWQKKMPGGVEGALAYGRSKLIVGDTKGNLVAYNAHDGSEAWRFKIQSEWLSPPLIARDKVYAATSSDELYALSDATGKELWHYSHRGDEKMTVRGTAAPVAYGGDVFQGFSDGYLVALAAAGGEVRWTKKLRSKDRFYDVDSTPYVDEKRVIAATFDGKLYSLDRVTGEIQWMFPVGSYAGFYAENDRLVFAGLDGNLYGLDLNRGSVLWKKPFQKGIGLAPAKVGDYVVVTTSSDPVYLLDPATGDIVWTGTLGAGTLAAATGVSDTGSAGGSPWFYCLSNYGILYSFELRKDLKLSKGPETIPSPSALYPIAKRDGNQPAS